MPVVRRHARSAGKLHHGPTIEVRAASSFSMNCILALCLNHCNDQRIPYVILLSQHCRIDVTCCIVLVETCQRPC